ncbi:MAG: TMEM43 family protein [Caulobacteraceae bacterium]|nr:TMEM43 family protein [Caulobacteraceae bacterium]
MPDSHRVTTRENYFQRLGSSLIGALIGLVLLIVASIVLFWNEGRAVDASRGLDAGSRAVVSLSAPTIDASRDGALIHMSGNAVTTAPLIDPATGAAFPATLTLVRQVEMYQWIETATSETEEKLGGTQETTTTYTYAKGWSEQQQDSASFQVPAGHSNPAMPFANGRVNASDARLGDFLLPEGVLERLDGESPALPPVTPEGWRVEGGQLYRGAGSAAQPQVGDLRVTYTPLASNTPVSVVGRQDGQTLAGWVRPGSDFPVLLASRGLIGADLMIEAEKGQQQAMTWVFRGLGLVLSIIGFTLLLNPLRAIANVVPLVASVIGAGTGIIGFALGVLLTTVVIAVAWFAVRPLLSVVLVATGICVWLGVRLVARRRKAA